MLNKKLIFEVYFIIRELPIVTVGLVLYTQKNLAVIRNSEFENIFNMYHESNTVTLTLTCSKSAKEILEKSVKYVHSYQ